MRAFYHIFFWFSCCFRFIVVTWSQLFVDRQNKLSWRKSTTTTTSIDREMTKKLNLSSIVDSSMSFLHHIRYPTWIKSNFVCCYQVSLGTKKSSLFCISMRLFLYSLYSLKFLKKNAGDGDRVNKHVVQLKEFNQTMTTVYFHWQFK